GTVAKAGMRNLAYVPNRIEIAAGTTVEWTNNDPLAHSVTAADRSFDSGLIQPGATWRYTFTRPGTYDFSCTPHPFMKGTVVVR
ncbi:MAG TPA: cupredoxin family copper-binding protein, partial [Longimicrobium sp.]|nr:cupredoxin family copper-binding protein [Longimicrobium sp.]